jgi:hypothetical protein
VKRLWLLLIPCLALGQSVPNGTITQGQVWTPAQWNFAWQSKANVTSGTLTNPTITNPSINGGSVNSSTINSSTISAPTITGGTLTGSSISGGSLSGTSITDPTITSGITVTGLASFTATTGADAITAQGVSGSAAVTITAGAAATGSVGLAVVGNGAQNALGVTGEGAAAPLVIDGTNANGYQIVFQDGGTELGWLGPGSNNITGIAHDDIGISSFGGRVVLGCDNGTIACFYTSATTGQVEADGSANQYAMIITSPNTAGQSYGPEILAGTNSSDFALTITTRGGTQAFNIHGDGGIGVGGFPTDEGYGTINVIAGYYVNGTSIVPLRATSGSIGGGSIANGACSSGTVSVSGAATSMAVIASPSSFPGAGYHWAGYVSSANTVTVEVCNATGTTGTPGASTYNVRVIP